MHMCTCVSLSLARNNSKKAKSDLDEQYVIFLGRVSLSSE